MPPKVQTTKLGKQTFGSNTDNILSKVGERDFNTNVREKGALGLISNKKTTTTTTPNPSRPTSRIQSGLLKPASTNGDSKTENEVTKSERQKITKKPVIPQTRRPTSASSKNPTKPFKLLSEIPTPKPITAENRPKPTRSGRRPASLLSASRKLSTTQKPSGAKKSEDYKESHGGAYSFENKMLLI